MPVGGEPHVALEPFGTGVERRDVGAESVLGVLLARAAVCDHLGVGHIRISRVEGPERPGQSVGKPLLALAQIAPEVRHRERDPAAFARIDQPLLEQRIASR